MLVVPNQNRPTLAQRRERALHDPAAGRMSPAAAAVQLLLADPTDMRRVPTTHRRRMTGGVVIPLVQTQVLLLARRRPGFRCDNGLQCALQQFRIMHIGPGDHIPIPSGDRRPRRPPRFASPRLCLDPSGSCPRDPPKTRLAHVGVDDGFDESPQFVIHFPDCRHPPFAFGHPGSPFVNPQ